MKISINNQSQITILFTVVVVFATVVFQQFQLINTPIPQGVGVATEWIYKLLGDKINIINKLSIVIYIIIAFRFTRLIISSKVLENKSLLPCIVYPIVSATFFCTNTYIYQALIALFFFISTTYIKTIFKKNYNLDQLFKSGLLLGLTPLLSPSAVLLMPAFVITAILLELKLKEYIIWTAGYILPIVTISYILWGTGVPFDTIFLSIKDILSGWSINNIVEYWNSGIDGVINIVYFVVISSISILYSIIYDIKLNRKNGRDVPKLHIFFQILSACTFASLFLPGIQNLMPVMALSLTVYITGILTHYQNLFSLLLYILLLLALAFPTFQHLLL